MAAKRTHEQFLVEIQHRNELNPNYLIELHHTERYINLDTKLRFKCLNGHPDFFSSPRYIIQKQAGCPLCGSKKTGAKNTKPSSSFLDKLKERNTKYPPVYLAERAIYKGVHKKSTFRCEISDHPNWEATPISILQGHGCPKCGALISKEVHSYSHEQFIQLLEQHNTDYTHKKAYLLPNQVYTGYKDPLNFTCDNNHQWKTTPDNILNGRSGCPFCASSKTFSFMAIEWLKMIERDENINIIHRGNSDREYVIPGTKYTVDGYCKETNTIYEFHGNYWHGNPRLFNAKEINDKVKRTYGELYQDTIKKEQAIKDLGYNLVVIWEDEFDNYRYTQQLLQDFKNTTKNLSIDAVLIPINVPYNRSYYLNQLNQSIENGKQTIFVFEDEWRNNKQLIKAKLRHYDSVSEVSKVHARQCIIKECTNDEKSQLLNDNHVQGNDYAQLSYGAYYNNQLIAVMTFTSPRVALGQKDKTKSNEGRWELSRFCTDVNYRIPGIASKLLKHFQRNNYWREIYSYADKRWSIGNMYHQLGFELVANNPPSYWYVIDGVRKHRWNYRKDMLKNKLPNYDSNLTEHQNMINHGYWRVWDCGTLKFAMYN